MEKNSDKKSLKGKVWYSIKKAYYWFLRTFFCKKRVVFISLGGKQYSDNPRAVSEYLHKVSPKTKQIWFFVDPKKEAQKVPEYIKCKKLNNHTLLRVLQTSRIWVDNDYLLYQNFLTLYPKRKDQLFIETWHGDRGLKKCFYNVPGFKPKEPFTLQKDGFCDYLLTGSTFAEGVVRTMFKYDGKLLTCGYPRNDTLINPDAEKIRNAKKLLDIPDDTKILLYAPTFKGKIGDAMNEHIDFETLVNKLEEKTGNRWVVVYRPHHIGNAIEPYQSRQFFYSNLLFEDMADILQASDLLITDYSSCAGDFILTDKPVILYINDYDAYVKSDRGLHFKIEDSPYFFAKDNNELFEIVDSLTDRKAKTNCKKLKEFYGCTETGVASQTVCEIILKNLYNKGLSK